MIKLTPKQHSGDPLCVLCLGAHSDDIEIGCGATILDWCKSGRPLRIYWVVFSGSEERAAEAEKSARCWTQDADDVHIEVHAFRDGFFPQQWADIKGAFEQLKEKVNPDIIFTHYRKDFHQDHKTLNELTWNTFRNHMILEYEIPKYDGDMGSPNSYIPVSMEGAEKKAELLDMFYGTQRSKHWFGRDLFMGLMRIRGMECCSETGHAEGFYVRKSALTISFASS